MELFWPFSWQQHTLTLFFGGVIGMSVSKSISAHACNHTHPLPFWDFSNSLAEVVTEQCKWSENGVGNCYHGPCNAFQSVHLDLHIQLIAVSFHFPAKHQGLAVFETAVCHQGKSLRECLL